MILNQSNSICFFGVDGEYGFLSNHYQFDSSLRGGPYVQAPTTSSEQFFMMKKAVCFGDMDTYQLMLKAQTPEETKKLGRAIKGFSSEIWDKHKSEYMRAALLAKFSIQEFREKLLKTGTKSLIYASPEDIIWGVGLSEEDPDIYDTDKWKGSNLLGKGLESIRLTFQKLANIHNRKSDGI